MKTNRGRSDPQHASFMNHTPMNLSVNSPLDEWIIHIIHHKVIMMDMMGKTREVISITVLFCNSPNYILITHHGCKTQSPPIAACETSFSLCTVVVPQFRWHLQPQSLPVYPPNKRENISHLLKRRKSSTQKHLF